MSNFDRVSQYYDILASLVFMGNIKRSQRYFLPDIPEESTILIIGGGTGWILNELDKLNKSLIVTYIENSKKMLQKSQGRGPFRNIDVNFLNGSYTHVADHLNDVIITNFFLDVFQKPELNNVLDNLISKLDQNGMWIVTDFAKKEIWWQKKFVSNMYLFFKLTAKLKTSSLEDFRKLILARGFSLKDEKQFYFGMIETMKFLKPTCT